MPGGVVVGGAEVTGVADGVAVRVCGAGDEEDGDGLEERVAVGVGVGVTAGVGLALWVGAGRTSWAGVGRRTR